MIMYDSQILPKPSKKLLGKFISSANLEAKFHFTPSLHNEHQTMRSID